MMMMMMMIMIMMIEVVLHWAWLVMRWVTIGS